MSKLLASDVRKIVQMSTFTNYLKLLNSTQQEIMAFIDA